MDSSVSIPENSGNQVRETQKFKKFPGEVPQTLLQTLPFVYAPPTKNVLKKALFDPNSI